MEIVYRRPGYRLRILGIFLLLIALFSAGFYQLGAWQQTQGLGVGLNKDLTLSQQLQLLGQENEQLKQQLAVAERGQAIDQQALQEAQREISGLQEQLQSERNELALFRTIVAPEESETGLQIQRFQLTPTRIEDRWRFNLVLTQIGDNTRFQSGNVTVMLLGEQEGERKSLPLETLSQDVDANEIRFRFRYFQRVQGVLKLPPGFTPLEIVVSANPEGARAEKVERVFDWQE
ncbi:MAG: hypothetical protein EA349_09920 [Halomonadaceae bacterium]|nr:MAG: hypothetical protein EA349_09920 [Halomonadaceae bacterium]